MSKHRTLEHQIHSLNEIKEIMNAMKNLALMEVHRLARFLDSQHRVVASIQSAAEDFLVFYPNLLSHEEPSRDITLLIGSERGFCGNFNELLLREMEDRIDGASEASVVVVGGKLAAKLEADRRIATFLEAPTVVEEVELVLQNLMKILSGSEVKGDPGAPLRLTVVHHDAEGEQVRVTVLEPFQQPQPGSQRFAFPPQLNLPPREFLSALGEQYLFALLHGLLYNSLMAENQRRMQHMESAVRRLERQTEQLLLRSNALRQEEITEEIEVIMLSVEALR